MNHDEREMRLKMARELVQYVRETAVYRALAKAFDSPEGNLFERGDEPTMAAQVAAILWAVGHVAARTVLETGTNKGFFGLLLAQVFDRRRTLYTFDCDERAAAAVSLLNLEQDVIRVRFILGDTRETLKDFDEPIDLAWIDGGHDSKTAHSDITHAMRLGARWILIDDAKQMASVAVAVLSAMADRPDYERVEHPWWGQDARGVAMLRRLTDVL